MARVPLLIKEQAALEVQEVFQRVEARGARVMNIYRALAHSKAAMLPFLRLGNSLLEHCHLDHRLRELAILRVASLTGSQYEWSQHVVLARESGVTQDQMDAMGEWRSSAAFDERDRAVLTFTDEMALQIRVQDDTFQEVSRHLDEASIVELSLSVGFWGMVARLLEGLQVEIDPELPGSSAETLGRRRH
ncbi:MAG: carboxymuconolactone decarboxylase family protein [Dehalococcoidia bacterium]|nr:carboxymuconolactone decarboxylase family protein [Dehalococcoidia bacterium]MDP7469736.1 carboxymuconolactone decarboxylase family protein [Dehalococcoidia bacterium]